MTVWRKGMLAVKMRGSCTTIPKGAVCRVIGLIDCPNASPPYGLALEGWDHGNYAGWQPGNFRPAVQDGLSEKSTKRVTLDDLIPVSA